MARKRNFQPYWRPDFRIAGTLPDIKVIRTGFLINGFAIGLALFALFFLLQREFRASALNSTVTDLEQRIESAKPANKKHLEVNERFRSAATYVEELHKFYNTPFDPYEAMVFFSNSVPDGLIYRSMRMEEIIVSHKKDVKVGYRISINGTVSELPILDRFKKELQDSSFLNPPGYKASIDESVSAPDAVTRIFPYQLFIVVDAAPPKKGGK